MRYKNKKGAITDLVFMLGPILALVITIIVVSLVWDNYRTELEAAVNLDDFPRVRSVMTKTTTGSIPMLDKIFMAFVIAMFLGTLILGFKLRTSPIFIAFILIYMPLLLLLAKIMKDTYNEFRIHETLSATASTLTLTNHIMSNLPLIMVAFAIGLSIVLFAIREKEAL